MIYRRLLALCILVVLLSGTAARAIDPDLLDHQIPVVVEPVTPPMSPEPALPFEISQEKRLDEDDLKGKREGFFITGLPEITSDPVEGVGFGIRTYFNFNGDRKDAFFPYTPYRTRIGSELSISTRGEKEASFEVDVPYLKDSEWRLRIEGEALDDPNQLYFGSTSATMNNLNFRGQSFSTYSGYSDALSGVRAGGPSEAPLVTDVDLNTFRKEEAALGVTLERSLFSSLVRVVGGLSFDFVNVSTFDGQTMSNNVPNGISLLTQDSASGVPGMGNNLITTLRLGVVFDTRDFEPDPERGMFAEITDEISLKPLGSSFNFTKVFVQVKYFKSLFPEVFDEVVLAGRVAMSFVEGQAPFFEYQDGWSTEGDISGLGGLRTLRGYKDSRFLAPILGYGNLELRVKFASADLWGNHFDFKVAPFVDVGRVWDHVSEIGIADYRGDGGAGLRIAWNQSTILMLDYAVSSEDNQLFLNFAHIF
jgi:hypothetical protein